MVLKNSLVKLWKIYKRLFILIFYTDNLVNFFGVKIPQSISNSKTDSFGKYLLLNSEFQIDTRLIGFQYYGESHGHIQLRVKINYLN